MIYYELEYCEICIQMTNHLGGVCQKCNLSSNEDNKYRKSIVSMVAPYQREYNRRMSAIVQGDFKVKKSLWDKIKDWFR